MSLTLRGSSLALLLLTPGFARAAEPLAHRANGDLAIQVRDIFHRYCAECHTGNREPGHSKLTLLDHKQVVAKKTPIPFVTPNGRSQILELVKDGSMPPANKPGPNAKEIAVLEKWVNANAPAYPIAFEERTTLVTLADDFERRNAKDADAGEYTRYVSFAHLIRDGQPLPDLVAAESRLREALGATVGQPVTLEPVDATATLFRLDTRKLGWHTGELFHKMEGRKSGNPARLQPFDLLLLEYPHDPALAPKDALATRLEKLLSPRSQARPVAFLRGDWLAAALLNGKELTPLAKDIQSLAALEKALAQKLDAPDGPRAKPFSAGVAGTGRTPLSAWYAGDVTPNPAPFTLTAELVVSGEPVTQVKVDQPFLLRVTSDSKAHFALLMVQADGEVRVQEVKDGNVLPKGATRLLAPKSPNSSGFVIPGILTGGDSATEYFVLLASEKDFPLPTIVRSKHDKNHIWRFLWEPTLKEPFDPNSVTRKVIPFKVTKNK